MTTEDDDDESFGDFTFAPATAHSIAPINGSDHRADQDDDWGDFVNSTALSRSESLPAKSFAAQTPWVKPKGALPLSLFGEEEKDEEGSDAAALLFNGTFDLKTGKGVKEEKKSGSELNVSELISNLYKGSDQSKLENGSKPDANGSGFKMENSSLNGFNSDSNGLHLKRDVPILDANGFDLKTNLDSSKLNSSLDDDGGWEFKGVESKLRTGDFNFKSHSQVKAEHVPTENVQRPNLNGPNLSSNVLCSELSGMNSNFKGVNSDENGFSSSLADKSEDFWDYDEWEFKDAESEAQSEDSNHKVDSSGLENTEGVKHTFDSGGRVPTDFFVAPDKVSQKSGKWDFGFDFSRSSVTLDSISNSNSNSQQKNDGDGLNSTPVGGNVDNGENFWAFNNAFSEDGSKDKVNEVKLKKDWGALPLSIFGEEELETDGHLVQQDVTTNYLASSRRDDIKKSKGSNISINDLIRFIQSS